jgi:hypothetical protein
MKKTSVRVTPELLRSSAHRAAGQITRNGWRPSSNDLAELRASTGDGRAYRALMRAWRAAGFPLTAIKRLAGRAPARP